MESILSRYFYTLKKVANYCPASSTHTVSVFSVRNLADTLIFSVSDALQPLQSCAKLPLVMPAGYDDIAPYHGVRYCAGTYERDLSRVECQQTLDARYQGSRPLALARLTISLPASPDLHRYAFDRFA